jgi:hypothetical protein
MRTRALTALLGALLAMSPLARSDTTAPPGGTIAYAMTNLSWALHSTADGKAECPQGFNDGTREQFKQLFPDDGTHRTQLDTQLRREAEGYHPTTAPEPFRFKEGQGPIAPGVDLDGRDDPDDFTSPEGATGIDNQMHRVLGCIENYRAPDGPIRFFEDEMILRENYNRIVVELKGVDSLQDDDAVEVAIWRGRDNMMVDAGGLKALPGGTQRVDVRWGARYYYETRGRIAGGVLTSEPVDWLYPWDAFYMPTDQYMHGARLQLALTPTNATGLIAGYTDIETWYLHMLRNWSAHYQSYGKSSAPSIYKAMRRLADGHPDPQTGVMQGISSALAAQFTQVFVIPPTDEERAVLAARTPWGPYRGMAMPRPAAEEIAETAGDRPVSAPANAAASRGE